MVSHSSLKTSERKILIKKQQHIPHVTRFEVRLELISSGLYTLRFFGTKFRQNPQNLPCLSQKLWLKSVWVAELKQVSTKAILHRLQTALVGSL